MAKTQLSKEILAKARLLISSGLTIDAVVARLGAEHGAKTSKVALVKQLAHDEAQTTDSLALAGHARIVVKYASLVESAIDAVLREEDPDERILRAQGLAKSLNAYASVLGPWLRARGLDSDARDTSAKDDFEALIHRQLADALTRTA